MKKFLIGSLATSGLVLSACAPVIVGAAATGAYLAVQERGAKQAVEDTAIKTGIKDRLFQQNYKYLTNVGVHVLQGEVLLTGVVPDAEAARRAEQAAYDTKGTTKVYNALMPGAGYSTQEQANDTWIGTQLRTRLIGSKDVYSVNYITDTVKGHVYILGLAATQIEKERVLHVARTTQGVVQVHDYIKVSSEEVSQ